MVDRFKTQIIGNGPTAIGLPLKSLFEGAEVFDSFLSKGVALVGLEQNLGSGKIDYNIRSNSAASDFLETIPQEILKRLRDSPILSEISKHGDKPLPLKIVSGFEKAVEKRLKKLLRLPKTVIPYLTQ